MELILTRSRDRGHTWSPIERIEPPLVGPAFEVCHSITELRDGRWVWPCSTWMGWDGDAPNGMNAILLVSEDKGRTWTSLHHRVRPLGRADHPLGAALPRARRRPLADRRLGRRPRDRQDAAHAVRHQPRQGRDMEARPDRLPGPDDQDHPAARRPDPRRLPAQRRVRACGRPSPASTATPGSTRRPSRCGAVSRQG